MRKKDRVMYKAGDISQDRKSISRKIFLFIVRYTLFINLL